MKYILIILFLKLAIQTNAQTSNEKLHDEEDSINVFTKGGFIYPDGEAAFIQFLRDNILLDSIQSSAAKKHYFSFYIDIDSIGIPIKIKSSYESEIANIIINTLNEIDYWNPTFIYLKKDGKFLYTETFIWIGIYFDDNCIPTPTVCFPKDETSELK